MIFFFCVMSCGVSGAVIIGIAHDKLYYVGGVLLVSAVCVVLVGVYVRLGPKLRFGRRKCVLKHNNSQHEEVFGNLCIMIPSTTQMSVLESKHKYI